jgi:hypothetical protein
MRIAREDELGRRAIQGRHLFAGAALLARAEDLEHRLRRGETARRRDFLDERLDVGAEELGRTVTGVADEVEMARMPIGRLEPGAAFAEVDLPRHAGAKHPLQGPIDRRPTDPRVLATDDVEEIVRAEMPLLPQEEA